MDTSCPQDDDFILGRTLNALPSRFMPPCYGLINSFLSTRGTDRPRSMFSDIGYLSCMSTTTAEFKGRGSLVGGCLGNRYWEKKQGDASHLSLLHRLAQNTTVHQRSTAQLRLKFTPSLNLVFFIAVDQSRPSHSGMLCWWNTELPRACHSIVVL